MGATLRRAKRQSPEPTRARSCLAHMVALLCGLRTAPRGGAAAPAGCHLSPPCADPDVALCGSCPVPHAKRSWKSSEPWPAEASAPHASSQAAAGLETRVQALRAPHRKVLAREHGLEAGSLCFHAARGHRTGFGAKGNPDFGLGPSQGLRPLTAPSLSFLLCKPGSTNSAGGTRRWHSAGSFPRGLLAASTCVTQAQTDWGPWGG